MPDNKELDVKDLFEMKFDFDDDASEEGADSQDTDDVDEDTQDTNEDDDVATPEEDEESDEDDSEEEEEDEESDDSDEDEDETEEDEESEEGEDKLYKVKVDGEEVEVSLAELTKNYTLQKHLTQKGQEVAEKEKQLKIQEQGVIWSQTSNERRALNDKVKLVHDVIQRGFYLDDNEKPVYLKSEDVNKLTKQINDEVAEFNKKYVPPGYDRLVKEEPRYSSADPAEKAAVVKEHTELFEKFGFSKGEIASFDDPRLALMATEISKLTKLQEEVNSRKARNKQKKKDVVTKTTRPKGGTKKTKRPPLQEKKDHMKELRKKVESGAPIGLEAFDGIDF